MVAALLCLFAAKAATVYVPLLYKQAVDELGKGAPGTVTVPLGLILAYGTARVFSLLFSELRDALFARVGQHAIRAVGLQIFRHLHGLALRFHLARQTGGLNRAIERGTKGIQTLLSFLLFNILPTFFEIGLVCIVLWKMFDAWLALATGATVILYMGYTLAVTEWRTKFRRQMNETDSEANTKAIESLLNYETVKYFGNEEHEARRYDASLTRYERAAVRSQVSLSILNVGQAAIISAGLTLVMWMAATGIADGRYTLGDFVLVNTYLLQLYSPLSFFGFIYREIKQAMVDMERMFELLGQDREVADRPQAQPLRVTGGEVEFRDVRFGYDARRPILKGVSFTIPRARPWPSWAPRAPENPPSRACCSASTTPTAAPSSSTARTCAKSRSPACGPRSAWCPRTPCCSTTPSATTSATVVRERATRRSRQPPAWRTSTI